MRSLRHATTLFAFVLGISILSIGATQTQAATYANLLTNPGAETGDFTGWTINHASTNCGSGDGQTGWCVHLTHHTGTFGFQSTYPHGLPMATMYQVVDLVAAGYSATVLDTAPTITVSSFVTAVNENGGSPNDDYKFVAILQDANHAPIASYDTGTTTLAATTGWVALSHAFSSYGTGVRYIYIEQDGKNNGGWDGGYGAVFDDASTTVAAPAPTISAVASSTDASSATITWTTDDAGSSLVRFGPTGSLGSTTPETDISSRVRSHSVNMSGLSPCSTYYYQVQSADISSLVSTSSTSSFKTTCTGGATVSATTQSNISTSTGGTVSQGSLVLSVPAGFTGAASTSVTFEASTIDATAFSVSAGKPSPALTMAGGTVYTLKAFNGDSTSISSFDAPLTLTFSYSPADIVGLLPGSLTIYRYDNGVWTSLSNCSVNVAAYTVSCQTSHFSDFAIFGTPAQMSISTGGSGMASAAEIARITGAAPVVTPLAPAPLPLSSRPATSSVPVFSRDLQLGTSGADVLALQKYLNTHGYVIATSGPGSAGSETTMFGSLTKRALMKLQRALNLPSTGFFGPMTRKAVGN